MDFRFRFTALFLVIGVTVFAVAAILVIRSAESDGEANLVDDISAQSSQNAEVVAGVVTAYTEGASGPSLIGAPSDSLTSIGFESLVMSTLLQSSDIVRLSLFDTEGSLLWTSASDTTLGITPLSSSFTEALAGQTATGLSKSVDYISPEGPEGQVSNGDLASTYIPLVDRSTNDTTQVLEVSREVTDALDFRVGNARSSMIRTLFSTLGASFAVLFGIVIVADTVINRSRQREMVQELVASESQVAAEKLELRNQQLQQINQEHDKFLSMVSHELRTPLTSMLAFTEVLRRRQEGNNKEANLDHLTLMRRNGDHLNSLIAELLEVTDIHAEEFQIKKERFGLEGLIRDIEASAEPLMSAKNQRLRISAPDSETDIFADRKRVTQMLTNLLSNASAYSGEDTTVTVNIEHKAHLLKLTVMDQGEGISEDDQQRLFEQFYRGNSEFTRAQSGLGLGLPIVKAIVEAHNGKISVKSQPGAGTVVTALIPTDEQQAQEADEETSTNAA